MRLVFILTLLATSATAADIATLRNDYARHFFDAEAHLRLAKSLHEQGRSLEGFAVSEYARRSRFSEEEFAAAVRVVYRDDRFDNSPEAEKRLSDEIAAEKAGDATKLAGLADIHLSRGEWKKAEALLRRAMLADPDGYEYVEVLAEVLRRDGRETEAGQLTAAWLSAHPESLAAAAVRIEKLVEAKSSEALSAVDDALSRFPDDAQLHMQRAWLLSDAGDKAGAAAEYARAAELAPESAWIQGWTGRFFLKVAGDREKALRHYLAAYFLDPDFYDSEYAEGRIRSIAWDEAGAVLAAMPDDIPLASLLRHTNPVIVAKALRRADADWRSEYLEPTIALMAHVDPNLRYAAASVVAHHAEESFDTRLAELLASDDLLLRSAAAYAAGERWKEKTIDRLATWFKEPADLLQYDAASVLLLQCGEAGRSNLRTLLASGVITNEQIKRMVEGALEDTQADVEMPVETP